MKRILALTLLLVLGLCQCREKKNAATAKGNSIAYGKARCACEKLKKKDPPGDLTRCTDDMAKATRYLKINFEFNSFSEAEKAEIAKAGDEAFMKCIAEP
jgi:hypothetical protein